MTRPLHLETLAIGDELLTGKISDTNSAFVGEKIFNLGGRLSRSTVIADSIEALHDLLRDCGGRADSVICFGGLGPTSDDKTAEGVAQFLGCELVTHEPSKARLLEYFAERKRQLMPNTLKQVLYPKLATPMPNPKGLAPGFYFKKGKTTFFFLPGVPMEMKTMFLQSVVPELGLGEGNLKSHTWKCLGIWESELQKQMDPIEAKLPNRAWLGYRTRFPENHLTLYYRADNDEEKRAFELAKAEIAAILTPWAYTDEPLELEELILRELKRKGWRLVLAESCTGGLVAQRLSTVSGASESLWGEYTVYQIEAKARMLGVSLSRPTDAVSQWCSHRLAHEALLKSGCEISAGVTGYLEGGTPEIPAGTAFTCVAGPKGIREKQFNVAIRERKQTQWGVATYLLNEIYDYLKQG